ncbi:MAG TPA: NAD(P)/FAD-dependent oxidoreductase [Alphaproteobacteria bacterium]|nr:NAD(P)/FAD-dependent oxidoreductase [Alphaproteobacteria bacterium]
MFDVVIIGGGHNGLVCAAYLAGGGLKVCVMEAHDTVGGAAITEEFHPGFRNSVAAYTVSLLNPKVIRDLDLANHGLKIVERPMQNFLPLPDGRSLAVGPARTRDEVAKFSARDADRLATYQARLQAVADLIRDLALTTPPNLTRGDGAAFIREAIKAGRLARRLGRLGIAGERDLLQLFTGSAGDFLDSWFESDPIKAVLGFDAIVGHYASPYAPGTAYVLLHHAFGEVNGKRGQWGHAIGGMGAITQAMAAAATARGVEIRTSEPVREVIIENGRAGGVITAGGEGIRARAVVSAINPKLLFTRLVDEAAVPEDFRERMRSYRLGSGTFRMNVALSELPDFTAAPGCEPADHHTAGIIIAPSLAYMERAWCDARATGWAREPVIELVIPSVLDDSLAPKGAHVASLFCQHVAPALPGNRSWDAHKDDVADLMIATVETYAPNFRRAVIGRQVLSPDDLERRFGMMGGDIFHGVMDSGQLFSARPVLGHADYRAPVPGLYLTGAGTHPGGGVTGAPGHNAAREVLKDFRRRRVPAGA